jgi:hypothetical protein
MTSHTVSLAVATLAFGGASLAPAVASAASSRPCDAYSHHCTHVQGRKIVKPPTVVKGEKVTTLPFTGAEIVLMTLVGGGAIGAGTVIVVGARRRRASTA